jgi:D-galactarolactone cycloisomerase
MGIYYLEEPFPIYNFNNIAKLTGEVDGIYIADGEWNDGFYEFKLLLDRGCYHILQPDVTQSADMFEMVKIVAMAEVEGRHFIPHTFGNGVGLFANLQVALSVSNCLFFEYPFDPDTFPVSLNQAMIINSIIVNKDGFVELPDKPGLGIEMDQLLKEKYTQFKI